MWEVPRPWEEKWESLKVNESKTVEQDLDDEESLRRGSGVCVRDPVTSRGSAPCRGSPCKGQNGGTAGRPLREASI